MQMLTGFLRPRIDMDDKELSLWVLAQGATWDERIKTLENLLNNAKEDQMDAQDELLIRAALGIVREQSFRDTHPDRTKKVVAPHPAQSDEEADDYRFVN